MAASQVPVSVIVPNYNSGELLRECIASINAQAAPAEILVIDDDSTDDSPRVAEELARVHANVRVLFRASNGGAAAARLDGIQAAAHDWVALVDADDFLETAAVREAYRAAQSTGADLCIWDLWRYEEGREWRHLALDPAIFPLPGHQAVLMTLDGWRIHPLGVARKALYERAYDGFTETALNADELLTRLVFSHAASVAFCGSRYFYRSNPSSTTRARSPRMLSTLDSTLWLLAFAKTYPEASPRSIARTGIGQAWAFWQDRADYGGDAAVGERVLPFLARLVRESGMPRWIWRHPQHLAALLWMLGAAGGQRALRRVLAR